MKYIRMGTSSNFGNMLTMALASVWLPFLPLTAVQVLLNNLLYDLSQIGIPFDRADDKDLAQPHGWDMPAIIRFTLMMGPLSSVFDLATFGLLRFFNVDIPSFRAAWFMESMATQILVVFVIRTGRAAWRDRPHPALVATTIGGLFLALILPYLSSAAILGFAQPPSDIMVAIAVFVAFYLLAAEALKGLAISERKQRDNEPLAKA